MTWNVISSFVPQFNRSPEFLLFRVSSATIRFLDLTHNGHYSNCAIAARNLRERSTRVVSLWQECRPQSVANRCNACRVSSAAVLPLLQGINCGPHLPKVPTQKPPPCASTPPRPSELSVSNALPTGWGWRVGATVVRAVEWGRRLDGFYAMKLILTGNDTEKTMPALPARDLRRHGI